MFESMDVKAGGFVLKLIRYLLLCMIPCTQLGNFSSIVFAMITWSYSLPLHLISVAQLILHRKDIVPNIERFCKTQCCLCSKLNNTVASRKTIY